MDTNAVMKKQFAKLHEKVQNKYDEMQKKLEKSKSIDMLTTFDEDYVYRDERKFLSVSDLSRIDEEVFYSTENGKKSFSCDILADDVYYTNNVVFKDINFNEATITETVSQTSLNDKSESDNDDKSVEHFFGNNFLNTSLESLNELSHCDESLPPTPPQKLIRKKIGWLRARHKRKREEKEKTIKTKSKENDKDSFTSVDRFILCNTTKYEPLKTFKRTKIATVTIALIEATGIDVIPEDKPRILICRLRLGSEKRKSKSARNHKGNVKWQEIHHFNLFDDDSIFEIALNDKDDFLGRSLIDLSELKKEKTHRMTIKLDYSTNIKLFILLTISGTSLVNTVYEVDQAVRMHKENAIRDKYAWYRILDDFSNVGHLSVIVYGAKGLPTNDWYCVLNLNNERIQTPTDFKSNFPTWMKIFTFTLNDITSILDVIICDEKKYEEHSKVSIPLLRIENGKKWYALKESTHRTKGNNPRILLEMAVTWNLDVMRAEEVVLDSEVNESPLRDSKMLCNISDILSLFYYQNKLHFIPDKFMSAYANLHDLNILKAKASVRVINPKEVNYLQTEDKLDRHVFAKNLTRSKAVLSWVLNAFQVFRTAFEWESRKWSFVALVLWQLFCWFFKMWMLPLLILIPFIWYRPEEYYIFNWARRYMQNVSIMPSAEEKQQKDEKNLSLRQKITNFQETLQTVQNVLGKFASLGERFKNLFNFSVPFVSCLAIFFTSVIAFIIYVIPLRYIMMGWGIHKFTRKILRPNRIPNNELMDLLSRVPDDNTLMDCEEITLENISDDDDFDVMKI